MKNVLKVMVVTFALAMMVAGVFAQDEAKKPAPKAPRVRGEVTAVAADSITVKAKDGEVALAVNEQTKFAKPGTGEGAKPEAAVIADVQAGVMISASYKEEGDKKVATRVMILPAPAPKAEGK